MQGITREEFTTVQLEVAAMKAETSRNSRDVQVLFTTSNNIKKSVDKAKWQILGMVSVPVIILIIQLITKGVK